MWLPSVVVLVHILLLISNSVESQSIIDTLPGFPGKLPFKLETGYIGVGELDEVQLFYYFIESERNPKDDPLVLWLTGGPGCSGLSGLLFEIGPFTFDYANSSGNKPTLELNPYSWTKIANIIFLDAPVGTGFSYATTWEAYNSNDTSSTAQTYEFLRKWLMAHPTFLFNPLYIAGDSYSGKTVPIIVQEVLNGNEIGHSPPLNLKGLVLGNPVTYEIWDWNARVKFAHRTALISDRLYQAVSACQSGHRPLVKRSVDIARLYGPLKFNYEDFDGNLPTLLLNPYSWTQVANIIFLDAPVGSGFSYARTSQGYNITDKISAAQTYQFLRKWLINHPQFQSNALYVGGDSYSGMVVPIIVEEIYNGNKVGKEPYLKLNGYLLGNPVTDRRGDANAEIEYAYRVSLISDELYASLKQSCQREYVVVDPANVQCVKDLAAFEDCIANIDVAYILEPNCALISPKANGIEWPHQAIMEENQRNVLQLLSWSKPPPALWCRSYTYVLSYIWANDENVQNALHIRKGIIKNWVRCNKTMSYTYNVISTVDYHRNFTEQTGYRSLIYNGDQDLSVSYVGTLQWIRTLNMTLESGWEPWFVEGQIAGYTMSFTKNNYHMTYATVKGGGHTAPEYKPKESFAMAYRWFAHYYL